MLEVGILAGVLRLRRTGRLVGRGGGRGGGVGGGGGGAKRRRREDMGMVVRGEAREGRGSGERAVAAVGNSRPRGRRRAGVNGGGWTEEGGGEELDLGLPAPTGQQS